MKEYIERILHQNVEILPYEDKNRLPLESINIPASVENVSEYIKEDLEETKDTMELIYSMGKITVPVHFGKESEYYGDIAVILDACDQIGSDKPEATEFYIKSQLFLLFYILMNRCRNDSSNVVRSKKMDRMKVILKYVEIHYAEKITIDEIAREANCAPSYFMRMFRETIGSTFIEYLNVYRLTMSARLLRETEESVLEVAMGVGFDNLSYFNRCFKKKFQMTPGKYRREG